VIGREAVPAEDDGDVVVLGRVGHLPSYVDHARLVPFWVR
jgi:hypothetical protein